MSNSSKRRKVTAAGRLVKETHNSRVFSSILGSSLYFEKAIFEGETPKKAIISIEWETDSPTATATTTPCKENQSA